MRVGFVGLGKLGLPVATTMAARGLEVWGHDLREPDIDGALAHEEGFAEMLEQARGRLAFVSLAKVVEKCDTIFCAVQTPHEPRFEGITPLPDEREDFDYSALRSAVEAINAEAVDQGRDITLSVISTVLPGTMAREIEPLLSEHVSLVYNPSFIAMGTVIRDFTDPEFVLLGGEDRAAAEVSKVYSGVGLVGGVIRPMSIPNAELTKVAYNTFIGLKLAFANTLGEVCHKIEGCDVDEVTGALKLAHRRLISPAYLDAGMGDGGGCHPRDNIALSWLARELDLSYDLFEAAMLQRERHAEWLADLMCEYDLPKAILGVAYKPGSHLTTGSPARLVEDLLKRRGAPPALFDFHAFGPSGPAGFPHVFLIGCKHPEFPIDLPKGSVVIDPWRFWPEQEGVEVIHVGVGTHPHDGQAEQSRELRQAA